uniref:xyloglucan-specific galacturonosyltransferase 1-like n=1 Tax=Erigeron canadensis TaxID=72917 RepID=UPI001CB94C7E|nr:xyloglucan-specific galacturonosyltransferase 1-like [Erigeron canadensis]
MVAVLSKRKSKVPKKAEPKRGCLRSCVTWFVFPLPAALFFMILMFVWSSSTTYISGRIVHVCVSSRKLSNLYCLSATTQPNEEFHLPFTNSSSQEFLEKRIPIVEEKLEKTEFSVHVLNENSVNRNLKGDIKEVFNVVENPSSLLEKKVGNDDVEVKDDLKDVPKEVTKVVVKSPAAFLDKTVENDKVEVTREHREDPKRVYEDGILKNTNAQSEIVEEIKKAREVVEEQLRVHRAWTTNQIGNQNQCEGRGVYVYDLPTKFNKDLVAQCHDMVPWVDMCKYFSNNALGEPIPELGNRWFRTHQYSLELIFHSRVLNHPCRVYDENQAKLFYVPYYGGLDILRWHFKNVSGEVKDTLAFELVNWLEMQKPWDKNLGKDHVFVLGKISWDFRRKDYTSWGTKFLELDEMKNPIKLMIERQPWEINDIGIPHPTHFHPKSDDDIRAWQRKIISSNRRSLISFAGAARPGAQDSIRSILIDQCTSTTEEQCKFFDCKSGLCDEPQSLVGLFTESEFCLQPPGDSPTRKSVFDSLVAGCIPVLFDPFTAYYQYPWHLPEDRGKYSIFIDQEEVRKMKVNVVKELMKVTRKERDDMRRYIVYELMPTLVYGDQDAKFDLFQDAFSITINNLIERVKTLKLE